LHSFCSPRRGRAAARDVALFVGMRASPASHMKIASLADLHLAMHPLELPQTNAGWWSA
jgi:hypothetical protein